MEIVNQIHVLLSSTVSLALFELLVDGRILFDASEGESERGCGGVVASEDQVQQAATDFIVGEEMTLTVGLRYQHR